MAANAGSTRDVGLRGAETALIPETTAVCLMTHHRKGRDKREKKKTKIWTNGRFGVGSGTKDHMRMVVCLSLI